MKKLYDLIPNFKYIEIINDENKIVSSITMDSRNVSENSMFVAIKGTQNDGHNYITQTIKSGAKTIVCEKLPEQIDEKTTYILVNNSSKALGHLASAFYDYPSKHIQVVGTTGTNGKTSTTTWLYELFTMLNYKAGLISTIKNCINNKVLPSTHTTPDALTIQKLLREMVDSECEYCFMEVSSHAIDQNRIEGINFAGGIFTNLTHDHLDYHGDFKTYRDTKKRFFDNLPSSAFALSNIDDANGEYMLQNTNARKVTYALNKVATYKAKILENSFDGLTLNIGSTEVHFQITGKFNAYNLLAVYAASVELGIDPILSLQYLSKLNYVNGRLNKVPNKKGVHAFVDYAHTPDAVENILETIDSLRTKNEKLIVVIGAGGNRDKSKRPLMAAIAAKYSDVLILTSDNPRFEDPRQIIEDMKKGLTSTNLSKTLVIEDRREAIKTACTLAQKNDIIVVAGKGHETYQEINGVKYDFDDKVVINEFLNT